MVNVLNLKCGDKEIKFPVKLIVNAGYTGRNQEEVWKHVEELKELGVPAPDSIPQYNCKASTLLTTDAEYEVIDEDNTGEAEYVLLIAEDGIYVGVGSDHTDRKLEITSIPKAKQMCPNFISEQVWNYEDVKGYWDQIEMRSWIGKDRETLYQEATLDAFIFADDLLERVKVILGGKLEPGVVIFSGTVGAIIPGAPFSSTFECELKTPDGKAISSKYDLIQLPIFS